MCIIIPHTCTTCVKCVLPKLLELAAAAHLYEVFHSRKEFSFVIWVWGVAEMCSLLVLLDSKLNSVLFVFVFSAWTPPIKRRQLVMTLM